MIARGTHRAARRWRRKGSNAERSTRWRTCAPGRSTASATSASLTRRGWQTVRVGGERTQTRTESSLCASDAHSRQDDVALGGRSGRGTFAPSPARQLELLAPPARPLTPGASAPTPSSPPLAPSLPDSLAGACAPAAPPLLPPQRPARPTGLRCSPSSSSPLSSCSPRCLSGAVALRPDVSRALRLGGSGRAQGARAATAHLTRSGRVRWCRVPGGGGVCVGPRACSAARAVGRRGEETGGGERGCGGRDGSGRVGSGIPWSRRLPRRGSCRDGDSRRARSPGRARMRIGPVGWALNAHMCSSIAR